MQPITVVSKCIAKFFSGSFMHEQMYVDIQLPQIFEILEWNERLAAELCGRVFGNDERPNRSC
jgi:hypothetical protein